MSAKTVIDELVVLLGLDATQYTQQRKAVATQDEKDAKKKKDLEDRQAREARERATKEKQQQVERKKLTEDTIKSVADLGRTIAGAFLGFEGVAGFIGALGKINDSQAALGRSSTRLGVDAKAMNIYGKAVELAGGKAEDAQATFAKLADEKSLKDLTGAIGPLLNLFQQKGVRYEDANGKLRDMGTLLDELSEKTKDMDDQDRAALFARVGISDGVINRMLEESKIQAAQLQQARDFNNATAGSVENAEKLKTAWQGVEQAVAKSNTRILEAATPTVTHWLDYIADKIGGASDGKTTEDFRAAVGAPDRVERQNAAMLKYGPMLKAQAEAQAAQRLQGAGGYIAPKSGTQAAKNNNPGNLEDRTGHFRVFESLEAGRAAQIADIEAKFRKGFDTIASIITRYEGTDGIKDPKTLAEYIARASRLTGKGANDKLTAADLPNLINAMTAVESGISDKELAAQGTPNFATPRAGVPGNTSNSSATNITVTAPITVNSPNADPSAVAGQTAGALQRKISVSQANAGQN